ncbi:putative Sulfate transporter [Taphrina deformans PYCC 5710]|uniref:Sulfate transporter n=1 Tax=Taphrina deformans (strain PYCC 5710 / ATCC 11124 / CBS 356.35 / IMI 108563 / JCM 9778 / NBRC 8474) TaxID=1097556 RepID=R4XCK3_TAPDE|nr:putative Sulfate transporter [Taphrina deformans PYCC 5710]|eukprot:CCG83556.1 putative Sulfate transporter [Taphrina deformans PYCC 5710]
MSGLANKLLRDRKAEEHREAVARNYPSSFPPSYFEEEPTVQSFFHSKFPQPASQFRNYLVSLFPIATWIYRYNLKWFIGDLVAGVTVGAVVVPQGMAYAKIATLPVQFGLYSSFVGVSLYFMFATSKDITIGPVAVMSALTGDILTHAKATHPHLEGHVVASALAIVAGSIVMFFGLARLGFIVDFIPIPSIAAFMTGSAINIIAGQVPSLLGNNITGLVKPVFNTRAATYRVIINTLKYLPRSRLDSAFGVSALVMLYAIKWSLQFLAKRHPSRAKTYFFLATLRTAFVILLFTMISWLVNRQHRKKPRVAILGTVPRGFQNIGVPTINADIIGSFTSYLPSAVVVLLIEHIAISKSFGRINNYTINPNQELIAIGITNIFGPFFGAYPATGSFSRTAIKSKAGVRTPLAGVITAIVVVISIYALPPVFFFIPNAALSAVIIHAVADLCSTPRQILHFWQVSPVEFAIFIIGVLVTIFSTIEIGIYVTVATSLAVLLWRIAKSRGSFVGAVRVGTIKVADSKVGYPRNIYVALDHSDGLNPQVTPSAPPEGIFVYRFNEGFLYPNANHFTDHMVAQIMSQTQPGKANPYGSLGDRPWNDPGPRHKDDSLLADDSRPKLRALILDFSGVPHLDLTGLQNLIDCRNQLDRHASATVQWRFVGISNPWIKRALLKGNFGVSENRDFAMFSVAHVGQGSSDKRETQQGDAENGIELSTVKSIRDTAVLPLLSIDRPYFHIDIDEAIRAVENESFNAPGYAANSEGSVSREDLTYSAKN